MHKKMGRESAYRHPRFVWVPEGTTKVHWSKGREPAAKNKCISMTDVRYVTHGLPTKLAGKYSKQRAFPASCVRRVLRPTSNARARALLRAGEELAARCITLETGNPKTTLNLLLPDVAAATQFIRAFERLHLLCNGRA